MLKRNQRIGQGNKESDRLTVGPYSGSRVKLSHLDSLEESDDPTFINASYITVHDIYSPLPKSERLTSLPGRIHCSSYAMQRDH